MISSQSTKIAGVVLLLFIVIVVLLTILTMKPETVSKEESDYTRAFINTMKNLPVGSCARTKRTRRIFFKNAEEKQSIFLSSSFDEHYGIVQDKLYGTNSERYWINEEVEFLSLENCNSFLPIKTPTLK